jgi:hypothetical protein
VRQNHDWENSSFAPQIKVYGMCRREVKLYAQVILEARATVALQRLGIMKETEGARRRGSEQIRRF